MVALRRSPRLWGVVALNPAGLPRKKTTTSSKKTTVQAKKVVTPAKKAKKAKKTTVTKTSTDLPFLPRTIETRIKKKSPDAFVFGVDEAGRGPLAGPVVAAACFLPTNIPGITDSKKITDEEERDRLYEVITNTPGVRWAAAVVDAAKIDEINILQATMLAMTMSSTAVISPLKLGENKPVSSSRSGCYTSAGYKDGAQNYPTASSYGLIDGNRCPADFPCSCEGEQAKRSSRAHKHATFLTSLFVLLQLLSREMGENMQSVVPQ